MEGLSWTSLFSRTAANALAGARGYGIENHTRRVGVGRSTPTALMRDGVQPRSSPHNATFRALRNPSKQLDQ